MAKITKKTYQLIDYYTGDPITSEMYETEEEAHISKGKYLKMKKEDGVIHNNLIIPVLV